MVIRQHRGFTLLEILLSMAVMMVLTAVFIAITQKTQQRNQVNTATLQMNAISNAAIDYYKMYKQWPSTLIALSSLLGRDPSCSVWKNTQGCVRYTITSAPSAHYFALSVVVPNTSIAIRLVEALPAAYLNANTVITYTSTFSGFKIAAQNMPSGILLSANNKQLNGACNITGTSNSNPFVNCIPSSSSSIQSYGLIDIANQPQNTIVAQNVFAAMRGSGSGSAGTPTASFTNTAVPTCPAGTVKTMILLPVGVRTAVRITTGSGTSSPSVFWYVNPKFLSSLKVTFMPLISYYNKQQNVSAGVGDILCLPATALKGWPQ